MKIWPRIRQLSISQLWEFSILFLKNPLLIFPTLRATKRTFVICNTHYKSSHHGATVANAFRHVLWNVLICRYSLKRTKNKQKSVFWAQKVTDLYEKVTQNDSIDRAMDLHNNATGRLYFLNLIGKDEAEMVDFSLEKTIDAQKVKEIDEMKRFSNKMVYLV